MYAQIIDDTVGNTLVAASTVEKDVKAELEKTNNVDAAAYLGTVIAKRAIEKGIEEVVFDRGGFIYHGKVAALAEAARVFDGELSLRRGFDLAQTAFGVLGKFLCRLAGIPGRVGNHIRFDLIQLGEFI